MDNRHTFVICAYKESPYLEACIKSLIKQKVKTNIQVATSTPNPYIEKLCKKYHLPLYINTGEKGITQDWNYALGTANTPLVTIAHQDDYYRRNYAEEILKMADRCNHPLILFTDYAEIRDGKPCIDNMLLIIKRIMLLPLRMSFLWKNRWVRRRILSLGTPIPCPAVTIAMKNIGDKNVFQNHFQADEDWQAWEKLSKLRGEFAYCPRIGMYHRIHLSSETTKLLNSRTRTKEDYEMFCKFWPVPVAKLITKVYSFSEKSNQL